MAHEFVNARSGAPSGLVRISAIANCAQLYVLPALSRWQNLYTDNNFDLNINDQVINLSGNYVDVSICAASVLPVNMVASYLCDHKSLPMASPDFGSENGAPKTLAELGNHLVFMYRTPRGVLDWLFFQDGAWTALGLSPKLISNNGPSLMANVIEGKGIAFVTNPDVVDDLSSGRLQKFDLKNGPLSITSNATMGIHLLYHPIKLRLQKIEIIVDFLVADLTRNRVHKTRHPCL